MITLLHGLIICRQACGNDNFVGRNDFDSTYLYGIHISYYKKSQYGNKKNTYYAFNMK